MKKMSRVRYLCKNQSFSTKYGTAQKIKPIALPSPVKRSKIFKFFFFSKMYSFLYSASYDMHFIYSHVEEHGF